MQESKLIFIVSQPRAGSTLLQKIISNNEMVDTVSEPWILLPFLSINKPDLIRAEYNYPVAIAGVNDYLIKRNKQSVFQQELKKLLLSLYSVSNTNQYFIDKTPRYYEILPEIAELFPESKIIVLKRNPFASLSSMLSTWSGNKLAYQDLKTFYRDFLNAPFLIHDFCKKQETNNNVHILNYESLVQSPADTVKRIYDWLGISFDEKVLDAGDNEKVKGMYGDDVYKKKSLKSVKGEGIESWLSLVQNDKSLSTFYYEYQNYLSPKFLNEYGYETVPFKFHKEFFKKSKFQHLLSEIELRKK